MYIIEEFKAHLTKNRIRVRLREVLENQIFQPIPNTIEMERMITKELGDVQQTRFEIAKVSVHPPNSNGVYRGQVALLVTARLEYILLDFALSTS